ncbi:MAG: sugar phosphate isomerase/epimerase [Planctomycetota bacterium]
MGLPLALQLYSVREQCKADLRGTLEQVALWGYHGVEFAGLHGHTPEAVRDMLDEFALRCCGAHVALDEFADETFEQTLTDYGTLGCPNLIVPWLAPNLRDSVASSMKTAAELSVLCERLGPRGFAAGFHAHWQDMTPLEEAGGIETSPWYVIGRNTPDAFIMQYDTGNGVAGGADAVRPIQDFPGRARVLHLKSFVVADADEQGHRHAGLGQAAIGSDELDWDAILNAARGPGGTHWLVVEQEGHATLDPMAAAEASLRGLQKYVKPVTL